MYIIWVAEELCSVLSLSTSFFVYFPTLKPACSIISQLCPGPYYLRKNLTWLMSPLKRPGAPVDVSRDTSGVQQMHLVSWSLPAVESAQYALQLSYTRSQ